MKFKLDENLSVRLQNLLQQAGHDVRTVHSQSLGGCSDRHLYDVCCHEERTLLTFDLDFADITRFSPDRSSGIIVLRVPRRPTFQLIEQMLRRFLSVAATTPTKGQLWVVEETRIRIHQTEPDAKR